MATPPLTRIACQMRRNCLLTNRAKSSFLQGERVLFHYNGHGVPRPTANGEVWVFNKSYTQYIPLSIYDLQVCCGFCICMIALGCCMVYRAGNSV